MTLPKRQPLTMDIDAFADGDLLMPLETPILKVSRPVAACLRCRNAKIKCDGKLPACTSCERTGRAAECTSTNDQFARGKERSYVSTLETRLEKLQAKLEEAQRRKPSVVSIADDETISSLSRRQSLERVTQTSTPTNTKASRRREVSAIDELVSDFGFLSVHATARDFFGFSSAMSYARLIVWSCSRDELPQGTTKALPPRFNATSLLQRYFDVVHQLCPVVEESALYIFVNNIYDLPRPEPLDCWMVRMVLAISSASMSERAGDQYYLDAIGHVCAALEHSESVLQPGSISSVQALVLLVQYALLDPHHFDAWNLIGVASRAMVDLGLHQDPPKGAPMAKGKLETRRRVFWSVYVLDRATSLVQARAFSFSDDSVKVKVPFTKSQSSGTVSPMAEVTKSWVRPTDQAMDLISLRSIQSTWYMDLHQSGRTAWDEPYPYIWEKCEEMRKWYEALSTSTSVHMRTYFELELLYSYIYVLAPSPRVPVIAPYAQTLIFEHCIRYATILHNLLDIADAPVPINFNDAMRAYVNGQIFLNILQNNTDALLSGITPARPELRPSAPPPPTMPDINIGPSDQLPYLNTTRAIDCIRKITNCLSRFGQRWGYQSWSNSFASATGPMLEQLTERQRSYEVMLGHRRPSMWQGGSSHHGSVSSNGGSISLSRSAANSISLPPSNYGSVSSPPMAMFNPGNSASPPSLSPPAHYQPQLWQQQGGSMPTLYRPSSHSSVGGTMPVQQMSVGGDLSAQYAEAPPTFPGMNAAPHQQFGAWGGYNATHHVPDTLDEENAVPPGNVWDQYGR